MPAAAGPGARTCLPAAAGRCPCPVPCAAGPVSTCMSCMWVWSEWTQRGVCTADPGPVVLSRCLLMEDSHVAAASQRPSACMWMHAWAKACFGRPPGDSCTDTRWGWCVAETGRFVTTRPAEQAAPQQVLPGQQGHLFRPWKRVRVGTSCRDSTLPSSGAWPAAWGIPSETAPSTPRTMSCSDPSVRGMPGGTGRTSGGGLCAAHAPHSVLARGREVPRSRRPNLSFGLRGL